MTRWIDYIDTPCDTELFVQAAEAWGDGLEVPIRPPDEPRPAGLYLADMPVNRAAMHVVRQLRAKGVQNTQAYLWRLLHLHEIFEALPALGFVDLVRDDEVHTDVFRAAAVARLQTPVAQAMREDGPVFDLADIVARIEQFRAAEKAAG